MSIEKHLLEDETILASVKVRKVAFYATNKRVLRYEKRLFREKLHSLYYPHIASISLETKSFLWLTILGAIVIGVGVWGWINLMTPFRVLYNMILFAVGAVLVVIGILYRPAWYQIRAVGLSGKDLKLWRIANVKAQDVRNFAHFIEKQITSTT